MISTEESSTPESKNALENVSAAQPLKELDWQKGFEETKCDIFDDEQKIVKLSPLQGKRRFFFSTDNSRFERGRCL